MFKYQKGYVHYIAFLFNTIIMKKIIFLFSILFFGILQAQVATTPSPIQVDQSVTITVDLNSTATDCNSISNPSKVYLHSGVGDDSNAWGIAVVGNWGQDDGIGEMTNNNDGTWSITFVPETYFGLTTAQASQVTKMGMVFRNADGTQELKATGCQDFILNVGAFQVTMINPSSNNSVIIVANGGGTQVLAQNTNGPANYELFANGSSIHTQNNTTFYNGYFFTNLTENQYCQLVITQGANSITKNFTILVNNSTTEAIPNGLENGINYTSTTTATLVIDAPNKDFVYVAGSFNNWTPTATYAMKKDTSSDKFWLELTGLTNGQIETYQYWVGASNPVANSPKLVKTADPFSTLVLSPYDDSYIPASTYPNLPAFPAGQEREVTVLQTGQTPYNWVVTNFQKPKKEDLVIYEVLIRDFDAERNFQNLIDKIDYFKNLNINAIELMPVMEFEGNESWGYNTAFHLALDKFYGTEEKFKELIDTFHQNGIAVILDLAINHAFGRNPMNRMWMIDPDNDGWGGPSSENPYFNTAPTHAYNVGSDFNHQSSLTQYYTERVISRWINDFKIDGFRWDLTKGFTQNCSGNDGNCTESYQADRVAILKQYADYSWSLDPSHYVIFEHLGSNAGSATEETEWANYRVNEAQPKGIMLWGKMTHPYNQLSMGFASDSNINGMGHVSRGFSNPRLVGYAESHDEERLMYKNLEYGNATNAAHNVTNLNTALSRMSAIGAVSLTIPGPKMIWHFGDLGMENSIFTCTDGSVNNPDCKLATKPQPQWTSNWIADAFRSEIYNDWARINDLKINEAVFEGDYTIESGTLTPKIYIWDNSIPSSALKNVVILANFDVTSQNVIPNFPYTGTWYDLMDESGATTISVTNTTAPISLAPGEFKIYGNQSPVLQIDETLLVEKLQLNPNPSSTSFRINKDSAKVSIYDIHGRIVKEITQYKKNELIEISQLNSGIYMVRVNNNGKTQTHKLLKK